MKNMLFQICKAIVILALLWCCFLFAGCRSYCVKNYCKQTTADTTIIKHDTIVLDSIRIDSVFSSRIDSIYIKEGKLSIKYIKVRDSVYLSGSYEGDTLYITKEVKVQTICPSVSSYSFNEWLEGQPFWVGLVVMAILIFALLFAIQTIISAANKYASK